MIREPMIFVLTPDFAGKTRGKAFPASHLDRRTTRGVGWTPTNVQITCFDLIAESPFGALGDVLLVPDPSTHVQVDFADGTPPENFMIGDITSTDGVAWECCTRSILKVALARLKQVAGVDLLAAFEHEFQLKTTNRPIGDAYTFRGYRAHAAFGETLIAALSTAGLKADTFMKEYGADQYEVTVEPEIGVAAADASTILRELVHATAQRLETPATFTPIRDPAGVGNGVHVHMSFRDRTDRPATYDPDGPSGMSALTASFVAGILKYLDGIIALTAPSDISYLRLTPHRWSAAFNNLGFRDREAAVRICPTTSKDPEAIARQFNVEFRAADAAASPHLALAAIVHAGVQGIEERLPAPRATEQDLALLDPAALQARGLVRLPRSLPEALERFSGNDTVRGWFPNGFADIYLAHKQGELTYLKDMSEAERCAAYLETY